MCIRDRYIPDYVIKEIKLNEEGFNIILQYYERHEGRLYLPTGFEISTKNFSPVPKIILSYPFGVDEELDVKVDKKLKEISIQTHQIKEEPWASYKIYTNNVYNFIIQTAGADLSGELEIVNLNSKNSIKEIIFKGNMSAYKVGVEPIGQVNSYQTSAHAGVDRVAGQAGQAIVSPLYLRVLSHSGHRLTMNVIGTTRNVSIMHLNPAEITSIAEGTVFPPGSSIAQYPDRVYGTGTGIHIHIQESDIVNATRTVVNPNTHRAVPNATYQYRYGTATEINGPINWGRWWDFTAH